VIVAVQDANECWTEVVRCLQRKVPSLSSLPAVSSTQHHCLATGDHRVSNTHMRDVAVETGGVNKRKCTVAELVANYCQIFFRFSFLCMT